jgi:hypothetical protein
VQHNPAEPFRRVSRIRSTRSRTWLGSYVVWGVDRLSSELQASHNAQESLGNYAATSFRQQNAEGILSIRSRACAWPRIREFR